MTAIDTPANLHATRTDPARLRETFRQDMIDGLTRPPGEKATPPKHLYDAEGSRLFERICELDAYYPTRTETVILRENLDDIAATVGPRVVMVEPGAGSGEKAERMLASLDAPAGFAPVEISASALQQCALRLARRFPETNIYPICADFAAEESLLDHLPDAQRILFFPGSTIGNLDETERRELLARFRRIVGDGGLFLLGYDLVKDPDVLRRAYDDPEGVTAAFNLNLISRLNRELGADLDRSRFDHAARWVESRRRIEMRIVSRERQATTIDGHEIDFEAGESIHTESSHKFTRASMRDEAGAAGFEAVRTWTDDRTWFAVALFRAG